jgi:hypothetical protein
LPRHHALNFAVNRDRSRQPILVRKRNHDLELSPILRRIACKAGDQQQSWHRERKCTGSDPRIDARDVELIAGSL